MLNSARKRVGDGRKREVGRRKNGEKEMNVERCIHASFS